MPLSQYIDEHLLGSGGGYLAQHELFAQIPQLRKDFATPDYCSLLCEDEEEDPEAGGDVVANAWLGPNGTCSPCHTDPTHNLLCQVVGSKEITLFAPQHSAGLYPNEGIMSNTSRVDVGASAVNTEEYPLFARTPRHTCVLRAGEALYIPPLWWHYIRSLETSFSVSLWWGKKRQLVHDGGTYAVT
eukprot:TRINITY_DN8338_c0_g1_i1.p1 TRINITY_DN8338_c0_g1~~TRINITY_DN8338_c0_g1_i1.p1  ORF type:complete len:186 (-),score=38.99 TRINITY_DN8338_c0_g1_i1:348-905(-)